MQLTGSAGPYIGGEITIPETLTTRWTTVSLPLAVFANVDRRHLYVVSETVFLGSAPETVQLRDLRYSPASVPAPVFGLARMPFNVYDEGGDPGDHYVPSGYMGDSSTIGMNLYWNRGPVPGGVGWAGVYWQDPADNWGTVPGPTGYDLHRATKLTFWVRGQTGGEQIQFLVAGITGKYGDSLSTAAMTNVLTLSTAWTRATIPLHGKDLRHIIGGFGWVAAGTDNPNGATFYLDDIRYDT